LILILTACSVAAEPAPEQLEFFEKKVRPVLAAHCFACHSSAQKHKANLTLDTKAGLLKGGDSGPAVVPKDPGKSRLVKAISYQDDVLRMPPKGKLTGEQIADLTKWVEMGAPWPDAGASHSTIVETKAFDLQARKSHWSFQPLKDISFPPVRNAAWPQSPIDSFILAKLEANGLAPALPTDKRTLIRRVTYDLIGLPPTPAEIDAFLADDSPSAFQKVVDRLLASPHYGERWARHWLDLVRFAETWGHEFDFEMPEAYPYRDYVIRAFNADVPYDQLVREHIAGDLLPQPRLHPTKGFNESILGSGFWYLGEAVHSPVDVRADEANRIDNQIDVLSKTFLGLTVACARCHDHKFDPISTKDYYALAGYLESSRFQRAFLEKPAPMSEAVRRTRMLREQCEAIAVQITCDALQVRASKLANTLLAGRVGAIRPERADHPLLPWSLLARPGRVSDPRPFAAKRDELVQQLKSRAKQSADTERRAIVFEDFGSGTYQGWDSTGHAFGTAPSRLPIAHLQPDALQPVKSLEPPGLATSAIVSDRLQGVLRSKTFVIPKKRILYHVAGKQAQINLIIDGYQLIRDPIYGGLTFHIDHGEHLQWHVQDVSMWIGHKAYIEIIDDGAGYVALDKILFTDEGPPADSPNHLLLHMLEDPAVNSPESLAHRYQTLFLDAVARWRSGSLGPANSGAEYVALLNWLLENREGLDPARGSASTAESLGAKFLALMNDYRLAEAALPAPLRAIAMLDGTAWNEHVHNRGNHKNLGEEVQRRFLEVLGGTKQPPPALGSGRLELAEQMIGPSDPLLARVMVNRIWQHHFGRGIVASPDNFGILGERPTHPELLDYLASKFIREGWSIKNMHRALVLSRTYQMSSRPDEQADARDPQNRFWHRMPIFRLEAEAIRDAILAVSGRLDASMYGVSIPPHLTAHMVGRGRPARSGPVDGDGRRSIYINVRRNFLTPMFLAFDYPIPFTTMGRRGVSNVPAQALALMNNPFVLQQAELWARHILADPKLTASERITRLYVTAFGRPPSQAELSEALKFLGKTSGNNANSPDLRAWPDLCHVLMNVKEFIFIS